MKLSAMPRLWCAQTGDYMDHDVAPSDCAHFLELEFDHLDALEAEVRKFGFPAYMVTGEWEDSDGCFLDMDIRKGVEKKLGIEMYPLFWKPSGIFEAVISMVD